MNTKYIVNLLNLYKNMLTEEKTIRPRPVKVKGYQRYDFCVKRNLRST